jgi:hypothetical protein
VHVVQELRHARACSTRVVGVQDRLQRSGVDSIRAAQVLLFYQRSPLQREDTGLLLCRERLSGTM